MNKIFTIIEREYLTRVRSKAFILSTFLMPLLMAVFIAIPALTATVGEKEKMTIYVDDQAGDMYSQLKSGDGINFLPMVFDQELTKDSLKSGEGLLLLPPALNKPKTQAPKVTIFSSEPMSLGLKMRLERRVEKALRQKRLASLGVSQDQFDQLMVNVDLQEQQVADTQKTSAEVASAIGYGMSFVMYFMLVFYGMFVMRGVIEEKTNRIVEIMASSVRPFQLMMGKVIGLGAAGLTQFLIWILLLLGLVFGLSLFLAGEVSGGAAMTPEVQQQQEIITEVLAALDVGTILLFLFYFLGGYLLYGSLFAAVGSMVDQEADAQQFTWPIIMPLIIPMLVIVNIIQNPNGALGIFFSHFPLFSPSVMMVRYTATDLPWWELALSMTLLIGGFLGATWLAARIYRVGILLYGKKPGVKEIFWWIFHR